jgi:hypothetical protein
MNLEEGKFAVSLARKVIENWVKNREVLEPKDYPKSFERKSGVFTTLHTYPSKDLRGCIGFPEPVFPLIKAIVQSAIEATQDPRFPPLGSEELNKIIVEVSVLTPPELIEVNKPEDYPKKIKIGKDGLIVRKGFHSGLLLPIVASQYGFDEGTFLRHTCLKAGLPANEWMERDTKIYKFQTEVFTEKKPRGEIVRE